MKGFFKRLFRPKHQPRTGDGLTHGAWKRGDLAVCIVEGGWIEHRTGDPSVFNPSKGNVWKVSDVGFACGYHLLAFEEGNGAWYTAWSFRKAVIDQDEACEPEFATLLQSAKRSVDA